MGADVGAIDAARRRGRREAILVGDLAVAPVEGVQAQLLERADVGRVVLGGDPVRVLFGIEETRGAGVVARPLYVAPEVALVAGRQKAGAYHLGDPREQAPIAIARVEHGTLRGVPVVGRSRVRRQE